MANRRKVLAAFGASALACAFPTLAQKPTRTWRLGYAPFALPMSYLPGAKSENYRTLDASTGQGAMLDLHRAIAKDAGYQIQFVALVAGELTAAIIEKKIDIRTVADANMDVKSIRVTDPIFNDSEVLLAHTSDSKTYNAFDDLKGMVIGSRTGTVSEKDLKANGFETKSYAAVPDLLEAIGNGEIKVAINTTYVNTAYILSRGQHPNVKIVTSYRPRRSTASGIGVRDDEPELLATINTSLRKFKANGTINAIFSKYGIADVLGK